jgi:hypothetical protein
MEFVWTLVLLFIFYFIGLTAASFTLIQVLIILFFGIPFTQKLERKNVLQKNNGIIRRELVSLLVLSALYIGIYSLIIHFIPVGKLGFLIGTVMSIVMGIGQVRTNKKNLLDYFETNKRYLTVSIGKALDEIVEDYL